MPVPDWNAIRADFPILDQTVHGHPLIYFDNGATTQKPRPVLEAMRRFDETDFANVHRGLHELSTRSTDAFEAVRQRTATYLGAASAEEIVFTSGTTDSINLVARSWGEHNLTPGDVILLTEMEHHSNLVPWQLLAEKTGATVRYLPVLDDGTLDLDFLPKVLTPEVKIFAFTHISNTLGTINPVATLTAAARAVGALTLVDAAQSAGHLPLDVQALGCDFLVFSAHKLCGPTGVGILFGKKEHLSAMPPWRGGGGMIHSVGYEKTTYAASPQRFEAGTPNITGIIGLGAALDYLDAIGRDHIFDHDRQLTRHAREILAPIPGLRIIGPTGERGGLLGILLENAHPHDLVTYADRFGLAMRGGHHCNQPLMRKWKLPGTARASFYFYNTHEEIESLGRIISQAQKYFS